MYIMLCVHIVLVMGPYDLFFWNTWELLTSGSALRINAQNAAPIRPARKIGKRTRAGTAPAQQSRQVSGGSAAGEMTTADSGNGGKKRYRSLRMNPGNGRRLST